MDFVADILQKAVDALQQAVVRVQSLPWPSTFEGWAYLLLVLVGALTLATAVLPCIVSTICHRRQSLKKKYNATWALVTGGSSGIGLSIVRKLAADGINVVVVAIPDEMLIRSVAQLQKDFPAVQFQAIGVKLGSANYLEVIADKTAGLPISLVFNNAGYIVTGFFDDRSWQSHLDNINCNVTAGIALSHLYVRRMRADKLKGCITFTSSPAAFMPSPFSCLYGATKACLTHFATSLAAEVRQDGIDVAVLHPSPVATNFYTGAHAMPTLMFFKSTATGPDAVAQTLLNGIGRSITIDQGYYSVSLRLLLRIIDFAFLADIIAATAHTVADYAVLNKARKEREDAFKAAAAAAAALLEQEQEEEEEEAVVAAAPKSTGKKAPSSASRRRRSVSRS